MVEWFVCGNFRKKREIEMTNLTPLYGILDQYIPREAVETIVECGARDCRETIALASRFPNAVIYTYECNPATLPQCRKAVKGYRNIHLIEKAVGNVDGKVTFYPTNIRSKTCWAQGNPGASSLFRTSGKYPLETFCQDEIEVLSERLETLIERKHIRAIDLLWMDIQGAELMALEGLGNYLSRVKIIQAEVMFFEIYTGQPLWEEIRTFLDSREFTYLGAIDANPFFADAVFVNNTLSRLDH